MKDKKNLRIKRLALKIVELENEISLGKNVQENQHKIEDIMCSLSLGDMLLIDEYIMKKNLLTK